MDHELKQRLIGAVVVTALAAIFVPMLFDDPVDNSAQQVAGQSIPPPPVSTENLAAKVPSSTEQVLTAPPSEQTVTENNAALSDEIDDSHVKPSNSEDALYAETPGYSDENAELVDDEPVIEPSKAPPLAKPPVSGSTNAVPVVEQHQDPAATKKVLKPKASPNTAEQELLKKVESAKLQQATTAADPKKLVPIKKIDSQTTSKDAPKQANPAKAVAAALAEPKTKPAVPARWYIQVGSFSKKENATSLLEGLKAQGLPASLDAVQTNKGTTYRLRVGPELDGKKAAAMKAKLDKQNISSILVSEQP